MLILIDEAASLSNIILFIIEQCAGTRFKRVLVIMQGKQQGTGERHPLESMIGSRAKIIANDGRVFVGILKGLDQALNCILSEAEQRVYSLTAGVATHPLGTYFVRGDSIVVVGEFDEGQQQSQNLSQIRARPLTLDM